MKVGDTCNNRITKKNEYSNIMVREANQKENKRNL